MINFFRKIRKQLANENKFKKYFRYAFGEILLVVIGILIALQVNNWNERRKQQKEFDTTIAKIYTIINSNAQFMVTMGDKTLKDFRLLEYFINYKNPDSNIFRFEEIREHYTSDTTQTGLLFNFNIKKFNNDEIEPWKFPHLLYMLDKDFLDVADHKSLDYYSNLLSPNPNSEFQKEFVLKIVKYSNYLSLMPSRLRTNRISTYFKQELIPEPRTLTGGSSNINNLEKHYFTEKEISKVEQLLQDEPLRAELRTLLNRKLYACDDFLAGYNDSKEILNLIKSHYPDITLNYPNVGIIGDALDGWTVPSRKMTLTNPSSCIWEIDLNLKDGGIKFKSDDSYANHWGGSQFPNGRAEFWGDDIFVKSGKYHVILNLTANTYDFIKQD